MAFRSVRVSHIVLSTKEVAGLLLENLKSCESNELMLKMFAKLAKNTALVELEIKVVTLDIWNIIQLLQSLKKQL